MSKSYNRISSPLFKCTQQGLLQFFVESQKLQPGRLSPQDLRLWRPSVRGWRYEVKTVADCCSLQMSRRSSWQLKSSPSQVKYAVLSTYNSDVWETLKYFNISTSTIPELRYGYQNYRLLLTLLFYTIKPSHSTKLLFLVKLKSNLSNVEQELCRDEIQPEICQILIISSTLWSKSESFHI